MSRTDKDRPWWLRAEWWKPVHVRCVHATSPWYGPLRDCDLTDAPTIARDAPRAGVGGIRRNRGCYWWPHWPFRCTCNYCNPRFRREVRTALTADGRKAIAEHRATGTVDREPPGQIAGARWCDY